MLSKFISYLGCCLTVILVMALPHFAYTKDSSDCYKLLVKTFDNYDFVIHPLKKGTMFHIELYTETEVDSPQVGEQKLTLIKSRVYATNTKFVMLTNDIEIYSSPSCIIQIMNNSNHIYIYDADDKNIQNWQVNQLIKTKELLLDSLKTLRCLSLSDTAVRFSLEESSLSYLGEKIAMTIHPKTGYLLSYEMSYRPQHEGLVFMRMKYIHHSIDPENHLMKNDFLRIIYDANNKIKKAYKNFRITDIRLHKNNN